MDARQFTKLPEIVNDFVIQTRKVHQEKGCFTKIKLYHEIINLDFTWAIDQIMKQFLKRSFISEQDIKTSALLRVAFHEAFTINTVCIAFFCVQFIAFISNYFLGGRPIENIYPFLILNPLTGVYRETFLRVRLSGSAKIKDIRTV